MQHSWTCFSRVTVFWLEALPCIFYSQSLAVTSLTILEQHYWYSPALCPLALMGTRPSSMVGGMVWEEEERRSRPFSNLPHIFYTLYSVCNLSTRSAIQNLVLANLILRTFILSYSIFVNSIQISTALVSNCGGCLI